MTDFAAVLTHIAERASSIWLELRSSTLNLKEGWQGKNQQEESVIGFYLPGIKMLRQDGSV
ncbi:hypothetical protein [Ochrobactrum sp. CGA5]|uniref:hypothetical protein n=1 Tax=Ochrobactrum sp. CGA5 TaxID=2583453 RepID=UPI00111F22D9|nr:hypothetical protein [Ochrobactrum sp. CGA5]